MDSPFHRVAATRDPPRTTPLVAPAHGPNATPAASTPTSGQTEPNVCDVEKACPFPNTHPSNTSSAAPSATSLMTAAGELRNVGRQRQADAHAAVNPSAPATRATATTGWSR